MRGPLLCALALLACGSELGNGVVQGSLLVPLCEGERPADHRCTAELEARCQAFDLAPDFFALETFGERVVLRLQRGSRDVAVSDALIIDILDRRAVRLDVPLTVSPEGPVRVGLAVLGRCPESRQSFRVEGEMVFGAFGTAGGDRVAGAFDGLEIFDGRPEGARLGVLRGRFDFPVVKGASRQRYVDL